MCVCVCVYVCVCGSVCVHNAWNVLIFPLTPHQNVILDEGESFAALLYTWRSMSRAVPAVSHCLPFVCSSRCYTHLCTCRSHSPTMHCILLLVLDMYNTIFKPWSNAVYTREGVHIPVRSL